MGNDSVATLCTRELLPITSKPSSISEFPLQPSDQVEIYISLVSNSYLLYEALLLLLQNQWSIDLVNDFSGIPEISPATNSANHLVLIDSGIGQQLAIERIQEWRSLRPSPYVIVLELKNDLDLIVDFIEAGAHGYALQGASSKELIQVIERVRSGATQCSPEVTAKLFDRLMQAKAKQPFREKPALTGREMEVLHCIARGYSDRDIAKELVIEVRTVKHHVHNILRKLNVRYRRDAAQLAIANCWLNLETLHTKLSANA